MSNSQWDMPEEVEISKLGDWRFKTLLQNDFPDVKFDPEAFWQTVDTLRQMRNDLWHRNPVSDIDFLCFVHAGIRFAIFVGKRAKAIEVEIEAETMLTGCSREQVLARLHRVFLAADLPKDEDDRRRECRRRVAIGKILEESGTELSNHQLFTTWNYIFQYPRPKEEFREEVFIEDKTLAVKVPLSDVTWPMEEDTEETYQEETYQEETEQEDTDTPGTDIQDRNTQETDIKRTYIQESMTQVSNRSHPKAGERTDTAPEFSEVSPSATTFAPGAIPYRSSETLYNGEPLLDYPLAATTPETAIQRGLATAAEDEHKICNLDRNIELGIAAYLDLEAASTDSSPSIPLFTFSPSMHDCLKW